MLIGQGTFKEKLPIAVPHNTAILGAGLRNSKVMPKPGYDSADAMFISVGVVAAAVVVTVVVDAAAAVVVAVVFAAAPVIISVVAAATAVTVAVHVVGASG